MRALSYALKAYQTRLKLTHLNQKTPIDTGITYAIHNDELTTDDYLYYGIC